MRIVVPRSKIARIVAVRFERAAGVAEIDGERPEIDNRGHRGPTFGAIVGVAEGRRVHVGVRRVGLLENTPLHAAVAEGSADFFELASSSVLATGKQATVTLRGKPQVVQGRAVPADSRMGVLDIHVGSPNGPIVGKLHVEVFWVRQVHMTLHRVTHVPVLQGVVPAYQPAAEYTSALDMEAIAGVAAAVFIPYGIEIVGRRLAPDEIHNEGHVNWNTRLWEDIARSPAPPPPRAGIEEIPGVMERAIHGSNEMARALERNHVPRTINVYFVGQVWASATNGAPMQQWGGQGVNRATARRIGGSFPGIFVAEDWGPDGGHPSNAILGRTLAHEMGHFFGLHHVGRRELPDRNGADSSWHSLLNLMHPVSPTIAAFRWAWPDQHEYRTRPRADDRGYGDRNCGPHLTQKAVPNVPNDDQIHIVRRFLHNSTDY